MSNLIVISFEDEHTAFAMRAELVAPAANIVD